MANYEIVQSMSDVVDSVSREDKMALTINSSRELVTPKQSFVEYFEKYNLLHVNVNEFKRDFLYLYYKWGRVWLQEVDEAGIKDRESVNLFWEKFKDYSPSIVGEKRKSSRILGIKILMILQSQKLRRLKRVLFSSLGTY